MTYRSRELIRDFPIFFEAEQGPLNNLTIRLEHPYVSQALQVFVTDVSADPITTVQTTSWELDERNGLLKLTDESFLGQRVLVAGYHYKWFTDSDLMHHVEDVVSEFTYDTSNDAGDLSDVEADVAAMGAVTRALWSLSIELALDIDVSTPEGMFIPAHQRYTQVTADDAALGEAVQRAGGVAERRSRQDGDLPAPSGVAAHQPLRAGVQGPGD